MKMEAGRMQVGELAEKLGVPYRDVRYVLEQGFTPPGVAKQPGRGEHRHLDAEQVLWIAVVLALKKNGVRVPVAVKIARLVLQRRRLRAAEVHRPGDAEAEALLHGGGFDCVDIAELRYVRFAPGGTSRLARKSARSEWYDAKTNADVKFQPLIYFRLDLEAIAALFAG